MGDMKELKLTTVDIQSAVWQKVVAITERRIDMLRRKNDNDKDSIETAKLRGRIAECKNLLAMANPSPTQVADDD